MLRRFLSGFGVAVAVIAVPAAVAQHTAFDSMMAQSLQQMQALDARMAATEQSIVQTNLNDPNVQARYNSFVAGGGNMSPQQYAYMHAATAGFSAQGMAHYNSVSADINRRDTAAIQNYHGHVNQLWADTNAYRGQVYDGIARGRGELLTGNYSFTSPQGGGTHTLPYYVPTHSFQQDAGSGNSYYMDGQSNYWMNNGNGWWTPLEMQR